MRSLRAKLIIGFGGLLGIVLVVSLVSVVVLTSYSRALERVFRENYDSAVYCNQMRESLDELNTRAQRQIWDEAADGHPIDPAAQLHRFQTNLDRQLANCTLPGELDLTRHLASLWQDYQSAYRQFDAAGDGGRELYREGLLPRYQELKRVAQQVADMNMSNMVSVDGQVKRTLLGVRRALLILVLIGTALAASLVGTVAATILRPLRLLTRSARQIETGNLDMSVPVRSTDEIGQLMEAFNAMASRLREFRRLDSDRLARTQQTTQLAIDSLHDAVVVVGPQGQVELANRAAQVHFNIAPGARVADLGLRWLNAVVDDVWRTADAVEPRGYESAVQLFENGQEKFLLPRAVPMLDREGKTIGVTVILVDVTRLRHADEVKSGLVSTVSHELRTPLTAFRMAVSLLDQEKFGTLSPHQKKLVKAACGESERLFQIVENVLNISRIESGRAQFEFRRAAPADILHAATEPLRAGFAEKRVRLEINAAAGISDVVADATFIGYALNNLLTNALKFTPPGGTVEAGVEQRDGDVAFVVADTGPGIPPQHAGRVFEKFFRIPRSDGPAGVGLGLAIAKDIVDAHGGRISFQNRPSGGSIFRFTLPAVEQGSKAVAAVGGLHA